MSAFDSLITMDPYGLDGATVVWKSLDAQTPAKGPKVNHTVDTPEQRERCDNCIFPDCDGGERCWYRLGFDEPPKKGQKPKTVPKPKPTKPPKEPQPPRGYDQEALDRAMVHNYRDEDIAKALGIGVWRVKRWIEWRYR